MANAKRKRDGDSSPAEHRPKHITRDIAQVSQSNADNISRSIPSSARGASNASERSWRSVHPQKHVAGELVGLQTGDTKSEHHHNSVSFMAVSTPRVVTAESTTPTPARKAPCFLNILDSVGSSHRESSVPSFHLSRTYDDPSTSTQQEHGSTSNTSSETFQNPYFLAKWLSSTAGNTFHNNSTSSPFGAGQGATTSPPPRMPTGSFANDGLKRKWNDEDDGKQKDAPSHKRISNANPYSGLRPFFRTKSSTSRTHKRSSKGAAHGLREPITRGCREQLPSRQILNADVGHVSVDTRPSTQVDTSTKVIKLGTAIEPKPLLSAHSSSVGVHASYSTLRYGFRKRKRPSEGEDDMASQPKKALRLKDTKARDTTNRPQHIYKLPTEITLKVFSSVGDEDVTKVRSTSRWFGSNMSDRFAEYCTQALDKKLTSNDKSWELSLTRSSIDELLFICRIPRVAPLITSVNINADCPNRAGVRIFEKTERAYQHAAPPDRKRTLQDFRTLKSTPVDGLLRSFRQMKRNYQREYAAHAMYAARGEDVSELVKVFRLLTHLTHIRIGGWSKNVDVDYIDLMSNAWRTDVPGLYTYAYDYNEDEELLLNAHDDRLQHVFEVAMAAIGSSKLTFDRLTVSPTILKVPSAMMNGDVLKETLGGALSHLQELKLRFLGRGYILRDDSGAVHKNLLPSAPNLECLDISSELGKLYCGTLGDTLAHYHSPRLRTVRLERMNISSEVLYTFLKRHKDSLRQLHLQEILLLDGAWRRIWGLLRDELQLESAFFRWLEEMRTTDCSIYTVGFPWNPAGPRRSGCFVKTTAFLGPQGDDVVDDSFPSELIEEVEMADGLDRMIRLSVSETLEQSCWYSD